MGRNVRLGELALGDRIRHPHHAASPRRAKVLQIQEISGSDVRLQNPEDANDFLHLHTSTIVEQITV